jgi:uncharacterized protein
MNASVGCTNPYEIGYVRQVLVSACNRIAPTWPLDQLIAVNPWWEMRDQPYTEVTARLAALARVRCLMSRAHYATRWKKVIGDAELARAAAELNCHSTPDALRAALQGSVRVSHWHNVSDLLDSGRDRQHAMAWRDEITHQISQFCGAVFQHNGPMRARSPGPGDIYRQWLQITRRDRGIAILMGEPGLAQQFARLPEDLNTLFETALSELETDSDVAADYGHALLLDINGWASWVAYLRWQDALAGGEQTLLPDLLAIRMAWELALWRHQAATDPDAFRHTQYLWRGQLAELPALISAHRQAQEVNQVWQRAVELHYQINLAAKLRQPPPAAAPAPCLQAAFCIDVRSEVIRRHLEAQAPGIQTLGFAGFFGLPVEYQPEGLAFSRPQLPGLLAPAIRVTEADGAEPTGQRHQTLNRRARITELPDAPAATLSLVEALGVTRAFDLLRATLFPKAHKHPVNSLSHAQNWHLSRDGEALSLADKADLAAGILGAMTLTRDFAPTVLLVGHGSSSRNNPHAASLDCGACGGQTGEINARVLAYLLNDVGVRAELVNRKIRIPPGTRFVAALHDTLTDEIECFDSDAINPTLERWLSTAAEAARAERAQRFKLPAEPARSLREAAQARSDDWSQVRPEWGLANCAAFVVAPRSRISHLNLEGRAFLHDYHWQDDAQNSVLELIMTAPMVVTHWINMQYHASVTDNLKYGSGNKVLHNVVGGNLGVFEGNGGDLRIGLPLQSVHDGERWVHEPSA